MMKIGLVQTNSCNQITGNLEAVQRYAAEAAEKNCTVICFPECFLTGYAPENAKTDAIEHNALVLGQIAKTAKNHGIDILVGFMERSEGSFYITHGLFRKDGTWDYYRKTHLGQREKEFFSPGDELKVLPLTDGTKIGIALCVETHYPDITQTLALRGAQVAFAPHAVPRVSGEREEIWSKYIPARGYDNRVYMACCNLWDDTRFGGGCMVTDPRGEITAACFEDHPALLVCEIDLELVDSFRNPGNKRSRHFYPAMRRQELYTEQSCVSHI